MNKTFKAIVTLSMIAGLSAAGNAAKPTEIFVNGDGVRTAIVSYDDLDLATSAGNDALESRVRSAARRVCEYSTGRQTLREMLDYRECRDTATQNAFADLEAKNPARLALGG